MAIMYLYIKLEKNYNYIREYLYTIVDYFSAIKTYLLIKYFTLQLCGWLRLETSCSAVLIVAKLQNACDLWFTFHESEG